MKKITALLLTLALLLGSVVCHAEEAALIQNGGVDSEEGWGSWNHGEAGDTEAVIEDGAAFIRNEKSVASNFCQEAPFEAGKTYRMTARTYFRIVKR